MKERAKLMFPIATDCDKNKRVMLRLESILVTDTSANDDDG